MRVSIKKQCRHFTSYRAARVQSLFDCPTGNTFELSAEVPDLNDSWRIGLVVGPSGSGKSVLAANAWPDVSITNLSSDWSNDSPIIDDLAPNLPFDSVINALQAAGLGSVPSWLRPYSVLSNGEKFRAGLARILLSDANVSIVDEFTSVIDRNIAKIASLAFAKSFRRAENRKVILLSCHYDIVEWVQPDWLLDTATGKLSSCLRCDRPEIDIEISRTSVRHWPFFEKHHYLKTKNGKLPPGHSWLATSMNTPIGFVHVQSPLVSSHPYRICRVVILPEWQGIGIGVRLLNAIAEFYPNMSINTRHPSFVASLRRHGWILGGRKMHGRFHKSVTREALGAFGCRLHYACAVSNITATENTSTENTSLIKAAASMLRRK